MSVSSAHRVLNFSAIFSAKSDTSSKKRENGDEGTALILIFHLKTSK